MLAQVNNICPTAIYCLQKTNPLLYVFPLSFCEVYFSKMLKPPDMIGTYPDIDHSIDSRSSADGFPPVPRAPTIVHGKAGGRLWISLVIPVNLLISIH